MGRELDAEHTFVPLGTCHSERYPRSCGPPLLPAAGAPTCPPPTVSQLPPRSTCIAPTHPDFALLVCAEVEEGWELAAAVSNVAWARDKLRTSQMATVPPSPPVNTCFASGADATQYKGCPFPGELPAAPVRWAMARECKSKPCATPSPPANHATLATSSTAIPLHSAMGCMTRMLRCGGKGSARSARGAGGGREDDGEAEHSAMMSSHSKTSKPESVAARRRFLPVLGTM
mmetsp:Transcript_88633/g.171630  ORF Transcript_88633/g.171630 Transcript_88633/m.171630 type:complete len:231 (-) Transcript_88633:337-1029(-)